MSHELKFRETSSHSFTARGAGLDYYYNHHINDLSITPREKRQEALAQFHFDELLSEDPHDYVSLLEKTFQIKALMYSCNKTLDITHTIDAVRLRPILYNASYTSRYAFDLKKKNFERFCALFAEEFDFKAIKVKPFSSEDHKNTFFIARIQTKRDNAVNVRACTLAGIVAALSERTLRDLLTMEFGHRFDGSAQRLLQASAKLSAIANLLDDGFRPSLQLDAHSQDQDYAVNTSDL